MRSYKALPSEAYIRIESLDIFGISRVREIEYGRGVRLSTTTIGEVVGEVDTSIKRETAII